MIDVSASHPSLSTQTVTIKPAAGGGFNLLALQEPTPGYAQDIRLDATFPTMREAIDRLGRFPQGQLRRHLENCDVVLRGTIMMTDPTLNSRIMLWLAVILQGTA